MIIIAGDMTMSPEILTDFKRDVAEVRRQSLTEDGCRHYSLLVEDAATGVVNVVEIWDNDDALLAHFKQPWTVGFFQKYAEHMQASTLKIYDVAGERALPEM